MDCRPCQTSHINHDPSHSVGTGDIVGKSGRAAGQQRSLPRRDRRIVANVDTRIVAVKRGIVVEDVPADNAGRRDDSDRKRLRKHSVVGLRREIPVHSRNHSLPTPESTHAPSYRRSCPTSGKVFRSRESAHDGEIYWTVKQLSQRFCWCWKTIGDKCRTKQDGFRNADASTMEHGF